MKLWLDCEYYEYDGMIDLISIGVVREDDRTYYAEVVRDAARDSMWLKQHVHPKLNGLQLTKDVIARELVEFCGSHPEFWGWFGAYDWVAVCQLFGTMMDLPSHWPMYIREGMQLMRAEDKSFLPCNGNQHHALADAVWQRDVWHILMERRASDNLGVSVQ